jgi:hypothetical protein
MKQQTKFSQEQQRHAAEEQKQVAREFASAEELLRHDAAQTTVPPEIAIRLQKSSANLPRPKAVWWKRLLGGTNP